MSEVEQVLDIEGQNKNSEDVPKEDLYQAGVIGIIKAYKNYKQNKKTRFGACFSFCVFIYGIILIS